MILYCEKHEQLWNTTNEVLRFNETTEVLIVNRCQNDNSGGFFRKPCCDISSLIYIGVSPLCEDNYRLIKERRGKGNEEVINSETQGS